MVFLFNSNLILEIDTIREGMVLVVDPGFDPLMTIKRIQINENETNDDRIFNYKLSDYHDSSYQDYNTIMDTRKWTHLNSANISIKEQEELLSQFNSKSTVFDESLLFTKEYFNSYENRKLFYHIEEWRDSRLLAYRQRQVKLEQLCKDIESFFNSKNITFFFGDFNMKIGRNGKQSAPIKRIFNFFKKRYTLFMLDEFRTSIYSSKTKRRLIYFNEKRGAGKPIKRSFKKLKEMDSEKIVNRDINSTENMELIGIAALNKEPRPTCLERSDIVHENTDLETDPESEMKIDNNSEHFD